MSPSLEELLKISNTLHELQMEIQRTVEYEYVELSEEQLNSLIENCPNTMEAQSIEDLERGMNEYFDYLARKLTPEYRQEISQKIEVLLQENVDVVNRYRQGMGGKKRGEKNYQAVKEYLDEHWNQGTKKMAFDDAMVKELKLCLSTIEKHRKRYFKKHS